MSYKSPTAPMAHQRKYLKLVKSRPLRPTGHDVFAVLADMGTGKTKMILDEFQARVGKDIDLLLVVGPKGAYRNWCEDKNELQRAEIRVHLDPLLLRRLNWAVWTGGAAARRRREALLEAQNPRAFFINVEAFSTPKGAERKAENYVAELIRSVGGRLMFVIDESTKIRSRTARRSQALMRLREVALSYRAKGADKRWLPARRIMSGLVAPKSPMDLFNQFQFLDWRILGYESFVEFRTQYAITETQCFVPKDVIRYKLEQRYPRLKNRFDELYTQEELLAECDRLRVWVQKTEVITGFRNLEELWKKIQPYGHRVLKSECLDLKPKIYMTRDVELTAEQRRVYEEIKRDATSQVGDGHVVATSVISQMIRLQQVTCGHARDEDGVLRHLDSNRVDVLLDVLEEHSGKTIVWCAWRPEIEKIAQRLREEKGYGPASFAEFHGGNADTRHEDERRFLSDPECGIMLTTQGAGGIGNTWNVATLSVYYANDYNLEHRNQSEDRNHRKGQDESVTYLDLVARGTTDERVIVALRNKIDLAAIITGDTVREWLI